MPLSPEDLVALSSIPRADYDRLEAALYALLPADRVLTPQELEALSMLILAQWLQEQEGREVLDISAPHGGIAS